jgi:hypothetical protein
VPSDTSRSVTELLDAWGRGDRAALDAFVPAVYESSPATVKREWTVAHAWLPRELTTA